MKEFALVVTIMWQGSVHSTEVAKLSSLEECESARAALLKTAAISGAYVRMKQADYDVAFEVPATNAECKEISN